MGRIKQNFSETKHGIIISFCLSFLTSVFAPLELYLTNIDEFWLRLSELLIPISILFFFCFFGTSFLLFFSNIISRKLYNFFLILVSSITVSTYIQGTFLAKNLPDTNGDTIDWASFTSERIHSVLAFTIPFVVFLLLFIFLKEAKFKKAVSTVGLCFCLVLAVTLLSLFITTDISKPKATVSTEKNEFLFSDKQNLIVLILDSTDNNTFKTAMKRDGEIKEVLDGFTYFDDALAGYPYTTRSIPFIFSGKWYENDIRFHDYRCQSITDSPFIKKLKEHDYQIGLYETLSLELNQEQTDSLFENFYPLKIDYTHSVPYQMVLKMAGIKYAPWDLKFYAWDLYFYADYLNTTDSGYNTFDWDNKAFYDKVNNSENITLTSNKCARIIHLDGAHVPFKYDKNLNNVGHNANYDDAVDVCVTIIKQFIACLKQNGIYDNSAIIILADHGYTVNTNDKDYTKQRMNPILMVKGINESHKFSVSSAPISYEDIAGGIVKLIEKKSSNEIFDYTEGNVRTRRTFLFDYMQEKNMSEYITDSRADDVDAMKATGKTFVYGK